jgi:hypothetical protein
MLKDAFDFTPLTDEEYADSSNVLEIITLWDRLADTFKTDKLRNQIKAIAGEDILIYLI